MQKNLDSDVQKNDARLKLEYLQWCFERHVEAKTPSDLKVTTAFMDLLNTRVEELKAELAKL